MKKLDIIKTVGGLASVLGFAATAAANWAQQKDMERVVDQKVFEALKNMKK